jgi:hypothetical protein
MLSVKVGLFGSIKSDGNQNDKLMIACAFVGAAMHCGSTNTCIADGMLYLPPPNIFEYDRFYINFLCKH